MVRGKAGFAAVVAANRLLICDTNAIASISADRDPIYRSCQMPVANAAAHPPSLYILTGDDIIFVQDGLRDGENIRKWMTQRFEEELSQQNVPWTKVSGNRVLRLNSAIQEIEPLVTTRREGA